MKRSDFEKLWFTGNVRIHVDDMRAWKAVWQGRAGQAHKRTQIFWSVVCFTGIAIGGVIIGKLEFALSPTEIGFSWWGVALCLLFGGIPFLMRGKAAQAVKNRIIREPGFYAEAAERELFTLEEY